MMKIDGLKKIFWAGVLTGACMIMGCAASDESTMPERESWENNSGSPSSFQQLPHRQRRIYLGDE